MFLFFSDVFGIKKSVISVISVEPLIVIVWVIVKVVF